MSVPRLGRGLKLGAAAALCLVLAVALGLLAVDVARWRDALVAGDIRYRAAPDERDLWQPDTFAPVGVAEGMLGLDDDLEFRRAVRALRLARLEDNVVSDPETALARNEAQARLEAILAGEGEPLRRSRAANLLGVLGLARLITETNERVALLESTLASLQLAIALDPANEDAKFNIELALQRGRGIRLAEAQGGGNPAPGGSGAQGAGAGQPGGGY
jgi:hypothetical protein